MKKVRFQTSANCNEMEYIDCHSPRPFVGAQTLHETTKNPHELHSSSLAKPDPVDLYECSNSSPYSVANKTTFSNKYENPSRFQPSNDLDLSMLDIVQESHRHPDCKPKPLRPPVLCNVTSPGNTPTPQSRISNATAVLEHIENLEKPKSHLAKENSFFMRRDNMHSMHDINVVRNHFQGVKLGKENNAFLSKVEIMRNGIPNPFLTIANKTDDALTLSDDENCSCNHCNKQAKNNLPHYPQHQHFHQTKVIPHHHGTLHDISKQFYCKMSSHLDCGQNVSHNICNFCPDANTNYCHKICCKTPKPQNAVDQKTLAIEKFEQRNACNSECTDVEKPLAVSKEKREPTVADLFKIIKLQNEQLQLIQEKVDKFISTNLNKPKPQSLPLQNYVTEHVALEAVDNDHKISIGVMTSFEMVCTSTVINKEIVKQTNNNTQVQCNMSQIGVKEVAFRQPACQNFLDGILPVGSTTQSESTENTSSNRSNNAAHCYTVQNSQYLAEEKTLNECSLYNVQVDNATTPLISPEQTMYLDVKDFSDSDSTSSDQSNVGWTYYNKVMTHVNNVLQDSDMPSSASALFRNTRQCLQMHIDKTNISVTKRVKFGDGGQGPRQPEYQQHLNHVAATDTSMKMNQLAAKYLKTAPQKQHPVMNIAAPNDMSFATRKYMERHQILQGLPPPARSPQHNIDYGRGVMSSPTYEMPRFLDITALKQQPKLL